MKKIFLAIFSLIYLFTVSQSFAQYALDNRNMPFRQKKYIDVSGSPYLLSTWEYGTVKLKSGDTFKNILLRYDIIANELSFKDKKGDTLLFVEPVNEFQIISSADKNSKMIFRKGYPKISDYNKETFFEILADGTIALLKKQNKYIQETKDIGSATVNKKIQDDIKYFLYTDGKIVTVKKDKKSILNNLRAKEPQLNDYIKANNINFKSDTELAKLITYYNSL